MKEYWGKLLCWLGYHEWSEWTETSRFCLRCFTTEVRVTSLSGSYWECPFFKEGECKTKGEVKNATKME